MSINYYVRTGPLLKTLQFHPATSKQTGVCCKECEGSECSGGGGWKAAAVSSPEGVAAALFIDQQVNKKNLQSTLRQKTHSQVI